MIYLTGDLHGGHDYAKIHKAGYLAKGDTLIILGDFGGVWSAGDTETIDLLKKKPFSIYFVCGNHENFHLLNTYPVETWNGGKVHRIAKNILHLMRGQVFDINGNSFFTMGGAASIDKAYRRIGISWWAEELPNSAEIEEGFKNLEARKFNVDYVLTHAATTAIATRLGMTSFDDPMTRILDAYFEKIEFKMHYFGHYHLSTRIGKHRAMYNDIRKLGE